VDMLQMALHRFEQLAPGFRSSVTPELSDEAEQWLRDYVCPVALRLFDNPHFRAASRWSCDTLARGSKTPERAAVESVDVAIVSAARVIASIEGGGGAPKTTQPGTTENPKKGAAPPGTLLMPWLATRPWFDLVYPEEYFCGTYGLMRGTSDNLGVGQHLDQAFFGAQDIRVPLGDYVCRAMVRRIDVLENLLRPRLLALAASNQSALRVLDDGRRLFDVQIEFGRAIQNLRELCARGNEAVRRDACCALVQVVVIYIPNPPLDWLGWPLKGLDAVGSFLRAYVRPPGELFEIGRCPSGRHVRIVKKRACLCLPEVVTAIAKALAEVTPLFRGRFEVEDVEESVRYRYRLVLIDRADPTVYWDGELVTVNWNANGMSWNFFRMLCIRAKKDRPLEAEDLARRQARNRTNVRDSDDVNRTLDLVRARLAAAKSRRCQLKKLLPPDLNERIIAVPGTGAYRLDIPTSQVAVLRVDDEFGLVDGANDLVDG
jgi:hypothetical protein